MTHLHDPMVDTEPVPVGFADRVMDAIALVPPPSPTRAFFGSLHRRSLRNALAALAVAWHLGTVHGWPVAPRVRARSFALVLAVAFVLGTGTLAAAAAVRVVVPTRTEQPRSLDRTGDDAVTNPGRSDTPSQSPAPTTAPKRVPATVHPIEVSGGGSKPAARPTDVPKTSGHDANGPATDDQVDGPDPRDDDHGSGGDDSSGAAHHDDHGSDDDHGTATPKPDHGGDGGDGGDDSDGGDGGEDGG